MPGGLVCNVVGNVLRAATVRFQVARPLDAALLVIKYRGHLRIINRNDRASPLPGVGIRATVVGGFGVRLVCPEPFPAE